jgi:copper transport protein
VRTLAALLVVLASLCGLVSEARAHAALMSSDPADGAVLLAAPSAITLTFNEPVSPLVLRLVGTGGHSLELTDVTAENQTVRVHLPSIGAGTHGLSWRVVSADGHPIGGTLVFSIGAADEGAVPAPETASPMLAALIWATRWIIYLALFLGVGGRFFAVWVMNGEAMPAVAERIVVTVLACGLVGLLVAAGLQGLDVLGDGFPDLTDWQSWRAGLSTSYGLTLAAAAVALCLALLARQRISLVPRRWLAGGALLGIGIALALSGHASAAMPTWLTRPAVFVHAVCVAFWAGALVPLAMLMRDGRPVAGAALTRFSRIIPLPVLLLATTGLVLAVIQVARLEALWTTTYGIILSLKLVLAVFLLAAGAWNRYRMTERAARGEKPARAMMHRLILAETLLVALVLGLVAGWRFTPPPRAISAAEAPSSPIRFHAHGRVMVECEITPGRVGPVAMSMSLLNGDLGPLTAKEVRVSLSNPDAGIEPLRRSATHIEGASWRVESLSLPVPGTWTVKVDVLVSDFEQVTVESSFEVPDR